MALRSTLSILGLWQYDNSIFSGFVVPEEMEKETAITEILSQCAELELVYPSFDVMQGLIANWSKIELPIWKRVYRDCTIEYNPIWNKDGEITETETRNLFYDEEGTKTTTNQVKPITNKTVSDPVTNKTETDPVTNTLTTDPITNTTTTDPITNTTATDPVTNVTSTDPITNTNTTQPVTNSTTNQTAGYNSATWENSEKTINELGLVSETQNLGATETTQVLGETETTQVLGETETTEVLGETETTETRGKISTTDTLGKTTITQNIGQTDGTITETPDYHNHDHGTVERKRIEQGNIGVTKTQEMLADDLALLPELNPYQFIVNSFKKKFCLLVY